MLEHGVQRVVALGTHRSAGQAMRAKETQDDPLRQAREGDGDAFMELMAPFQVPLCSYLARMVGNEEVGRDLAQETLIHAWRSLPNLREEPSFKAWLYRIATNLARSHLRRARLICWLPWTQREEEDAAEILSIEGPEARVSEVEVIEQTLVRLSPQYRACLLLQVVEGFSQQEIALLLGISVKSVGSNVCRAREQFRQIYASLKGETV